MAWYNIQNDSITKECVEKYETGRCGFCGTHDIRIRTRMKIYISEHEIEDTNCCHSCYHQNSKKAIAT
jgi:hypothetical protein